jgi:hypothetical protein
VNEDVAWNQHWQGENGPKVYLSNIVNIVLFLRNKFKEAGAKQERIVQEHEQNLEKVGNSPEI